MSKKEQTVEKPQEQSKGEVQEQLQEQQGQEQPTEKPEEQTKPEEKPKGGKKPVKEPDEAVAKRLMSEHGVEEIHKAGSYWFKKKADAEAWGKQQGCKVDSYKK